jgi:hypothetical protein
LGACCDALTGQCTESVTLTDCTDVSLEWHPDQSCGEIDCEPPPGPIPTVSNWSLAVMTLLLATTAKLYFRRRIVLDR